MNKREKQRHTENILIHLMMMCLCVGAWHVLVREKASGLVCQTLMCMSTQQNLYNYTAYVGICEVVSYFISVATRVD